MYIHMGADRGGEPGTSVPQGFLYKKSKLKTKGTKY